MKQLASITALLKFGSALQSRARQAAEVIAAAHDGITKIAQGGDSPSALVIAETIHCMPFSKNQDRNTGHMPHTNPCWPERVGRDPVLHRKGTVA